MIPVIFCLTASNDYKGFYDLPFKPVNDLRNAVGIAPTRYLTFKSLTD